VSDRGRRPDLLILVAALAMLAAAWALPVAAVEGGPGVCRFQALTGVECPTCGLTRSVVALAHGDPGASLRWHPAGPLFLAGALVLAALIPLLWLRRRRPLWGRRGFARALELLVVASLLGGIIRGLL
jgi:hypothetical protein